MPIKLYDPTPHVVEQEPRDLNPWEPKAWVPPPPPPLPFADSEADFRVKHDVPSAYRYGRDMPMASYGSDPRPPSVGAAEGTMQTPPAGFESKWSCDKGENTTPFTNLKKR